MTPEPPWRPSNWENHVLWLSRLMFRWIGAAGVIWEAYQKDPIGMVAFATIGTGIDVGRTLMMLIKVLRDEGRAIEKAMQDEDSSTQESQP